MEEEILLDEDELIEMAELFKAYGIEKIQVVK